VFSLCVNFSFILDFPWTLGINFAGIKNSNIGEVFYYWFWIDYSCFVCAQYIFVCCDSQLIMHLPFFLDQLIYNQCFIQIFEWPVVWFVFFSIKLLHIPLYFNVLFCLYMYVKCLFTHSFQY
jgi:hypothetical protein